MAEPLWTSDEIVRGHRRAAGRRAPSPATGVSIDTRILEPGDLFVALAGERDGHEFVARRPGERRGRRAGQPSRARGRASSSPDTLKALEAPGRGRPRARADRARRGAVTGSVGKTSVTQAIRAGLERAGPAHGSVKSYNNHIGVPLTLARMPGATERAIFEIGMNHAGEIEPADPHGPAPRRRASPPSAPVHIENFADGEAGVARAKAEIFEGLAAGRRRRAQRRQPLVRLPRRRGQGQGARRSITFGSAAACDAQLTGFEPRRRRGAVVARAGWTARPIDFTLRQTGAHWGLMSLAALLMMRGAGR